MGWEGDSNRRRCIYPICIYNIYIFIYTYVYIYIFMDDSHCGMAEANTTWESNYPPIKNKKQKQDNRKRATTKIEQSRPQPEYLLW